MPLNCPKPRNTIKSKPKKGARRTRTFFPSEKTISHRLAQCVEESPLNLLKRIGALKVRQRNQAIEMPDQNIGQINAESKYIPTTSFPATEEEMLKSTPETVKRTKKKHASRRKTNYKMLAKKFIAEYKYFSRRGELVTCRHTITYRATLWWMRKAGVCDNHRVTFRDVEVHFIHNLKRGHELKILGFIQFLKSLCEDCGLKMSTVLDKLLTCREKNSIAGMIPINPVRRKPIKGHKLNHAKSNITDILRTKSISNVLKTGKKFDQKYFYNCELLGRYFDCKNETSVLPSEKDLTTSLQFVKKWIDLSSKTDLFEKKDDIPENMKSSGERFSKEHIKRNFDSELLKYKRLKAISKDSLLQPYAPRSPCRSQMNMSEKDLKFTERSVESDSEEESYEYIESDSTSAKFSSLSETVIQDSDTAEKVATRLNDSIQKNNNSKALISISKDGQLNPIENRNISVVENSKDNVFQTNKCISVERITINSEMNSPNHKIDPDDLKLSPKAKAETVTEQSLSNPNMQENFSEIKFIQGKKNSSNDFMLTIQGNTAPLKSRNHRMNSSKEKLSMGQATEKSHLFSTIRKKSPHGKKLSCTLEGKCNTIKNNVPSLKMKSTRTKILQNVGIPELNESENELKNSHSKNSQDKLSRTKKLRSTKTLDVHTSRSKDKGLYKENKDKISFSLKTIEEKEFNKPYNGNNVSLNYRKCDPSAKTSSEVENVLKNSCHKLSQKCNYSQSQRAQFSSSQNRNKSNLSDREIKYPKSKKKDSIKYLANSENNIRRSKNSKHDTVNTEKNVGKTAPNTKTKDMPVGEQSLHAAGSFTNIYKTKKIPPKLREIEKTSEEISYHSISPKNTEKAKMQRNERCVIPSNSTRNAKFEQESNKSKNIENKKTLEIPANIPSRNIKNTGKLIEKSYPTSLSKNTKTLVKENFENILSKKETEKVKTLKEEYFRTVSSGRTGDSGTFEEECSLITHAQNLLKLGGGRDDVNCSLPKPKKTSKKKQDKRRTFTNLPVRLVRKAFLHSSEKKSKLAKTADSKKRENKKPTEIKCEKRVISAEVNKCVGKKVDVTGNSKTQSRSSYIPVKVTNNTRKNKGQNSKASQIGKGVQLEKRGTKEAKIESVKKKVLTAKIISNPNVCL